MNVMGKIMAVRTGPPVSTPKDLSIVNVLQDMAASYVTKVHQKIVLKRKKPQ